MKSARLRQGAALLLALGMLAMAAGCGAVQTGGKPEKTEQSQTMQEMMLQVGWRDDFDDTEIAEDGNWRWVGFGKEAFDAQVRAVEEDLTLLAEMQAMPLSEEEQEKCRILQSYFETEKILYQNRLCWEPNGRMNGTHTGLPQALERFSVPNAELAQAKIQLAQDSGRYLDSVLALQQDKAAAGMLMGTEQIDEVVAFCREFAAKPDEIYLIDSFDKEVDGIEDLSEEQKQSLKQAYREAVTGVLAPAYLRLADGLEALKPQCAEGGLSKTEQGKIYYQALIRSQTGSERTADEMIAMLDQALTQNDNEWNKLTAKDWRLPDKVEKNKLGTRDPEQIMQALIADTQADFPPVDPGTYRITYTNEQVEDNGTAGMYYRAGNEIRLTDADEQDDGELFATLAHEGFPGHMYQMNYKGEAESQPMYIRVSFEGYTEGWATYAEIYSAKYAQDSGAKRAMMANLRASSHLISAQIDLGVNHQGWGKNQIKTLLRKYDYATDAKTVNFYWDQAISDPGISLSYAIGYLEIMELQDYAKAELGEAYTDMEFHRAVLEAGPSPFWHVRSYVEAYVERTKAEPPQGQAGRAA